MITDPLFYLAAIPGVLLAGLAKGGFGGSFGMLAVPLMALVISPVQAAAISTMSISSRTMSPFQTQDSGQVCRRRPFRHSARLPPAADAAQQNSDGQHTQPRFFRIRFDCDVNSTTRPGIQITTTVSCDRDRDRDDLLSVSLA